MSASDKSHPDTYQAGLRQFDGNVYFLVNGNVDRNNSTVFNRNEVTRFIADKPANGHVYRNTVANSNIHQHSSNGGYDDNSHQHAHTNQHPITNADQHAYVNTDHWCSVWG